MVHGPYGKARDINTLHGGLSVRSTFRILPDSWQRKSDVYEELSEHLEIVSSCYQEFV